MILSISSIVILIVICVVMAAKRITQIEFDATPKMIHVAKIGGFIEL